MNAMLEKIQRAHTELAKEKGDFLLFACVELDCNQNEWDIVVCANWLPRRKRAAIDTIVDKLEQILEEDDFLTISGVIVLNKEDPFYCELKTLVKGNADSIRNITIAGLDVKEIVILQIQADENSKSENEQEFLSLLKNNPKFLEYIEKIVEEKIAQKESACYLSAGNLSLTKSNNINQTT